MELFNNKHISGQHIFLSLFNYREVPGVDNLWYKYTKYN